MKLSEAIEAKKLDLRLREKLVHEGKLAKDDLNKYLNSLEDDESKMTFTETESKKTIVETSEENL